MDIVFPLGYGSNWANNEIRFALRSIEKHLKGFGNVYIVGTLPDFLKNVVHIEFPDMTNIAPENSARKITRACQEKELSREFLYFNDDFYLLRDYEAEKFPFYCKGNLEDYMKGEGIYIQSITNTYRELRRWKFPTYSFEVHCPMRINKVVFPKAVELFNWNVVSGLLSRSLYANVCNITHEWHADVKINQDYTKAGLVNRLKKEDFFTINDLGLNDVVKEYLNELYPEKSRWEV